MPLLWPFWQHLDPPGEWSEAGRAQPQTQTRAHARARAHARTPMKKTHAGRRWLPRDGDMRHRNLARGSRHVLVRAPSRQAQGRSRARLRMHFRQLTGKAGLSDCFAPSPLLSTEWLLLLLRHSGHTARCHASASQARA